MEKIRIKKLVVVGAAGEVSTFWKYIEAKRKDILNKVIERATFSNSEKVNFFEVEIETDASYLDIYNDNKSLVTELSRKSLTEEAVQKMFE